MQAHREGFMSARSAANLSSVIAAATDPVVLVQPWLMTVAGWPVIIICAHLAESSGPPVLHLRRLPQVNPMAFGAR